MVRIIGIISGKGGVGKSVATVNLGVVLASKFNKKVAIIDCNFTTPHLGLYLGLYSFPVTLNNVLRGEANIENSVYPHISGLKIVPSSLELKDIQNVNVENLRALLNSFQNYDILLLDSAPGLGKEALITLQSSDEIIFVTTPHLPSVVDVLKCKQLSEKLNIKSLGVVLNRIKNQKYEIKGSEISRVTNLPVIAEINEDENVLKSANSKNPVVIAYPNSSVSKSFYKFASYITGENYTVPLSLFDKILRIFNFK